MLLEMITNDILYKDDVKRTSSTLTKRGLPSNNPTLSKQNLNLKFYMVSFSMA